MVQGRSDATGGGKIRYGMVGGGQGAFIGAVHRLAARMDDQYELVAGALSSEPGKALPYDFALPNANHVFQPGHRVMVQVQSSLFPLYDRNPQTFVPNIFFARPEDYRKATQRVWHTPEVASFISLPVL